MEEAYSEWIADYAHRHPLFGRCIEASYAMADAFPELKQVSGWVECERMGAWPHWYLLTPDGQVVDPTAAQFEWVGEYGEWNDVTPEPCYVCHLCEQHVSFDQDECCPMDALYTVLERVEKVCLPQPGERGPDEETR